MQGERTTRTNGTKRTKPLRRLPVEILTPDEVRALMNACGSTPIGIRHRALIAVMYRAGLRIGEALDLYPKDIDFERGAIRILSGKGGYARTVGIDQGGTAYLREWIDVRATFDLNGCHPLLCAITSSRLTEAYIRRLMSRLARQAGIPKRVHAHGLRHTHAAELRAEGIDIGIISKQLGHRSIATIVLTMSHARSLAEFHQRTRPAMSKEWTSPGGMFATVARRLRTLAPCAEQDEQVCAIDRVVTIEVTGAAGAGTPCTE